MSDKLQVQHRYLAAREHVLPQLQWDHEQHRVPQATLQERLIAALATSACTVAALQSWQCYGGKHPLSLLRATWNLGTSGAQLIGRRHDRLAHMHRAISKVSNQHFLHAWRFNANAQHLRNVSPLALSLQHSTMLLAEENASKTSPKASCVHGMPPCQLHPLADDDV